jgi:hypothetical protein
VQASYSLGKDFTDTWSMSNINRDDTFVATAWR